MDPTMYYENRLAHLKDLKAKGINPYPHKFHVSTTFGEYVAKYGDLEAGAQLADVSLSLAGRVSSKRYSGAKLIFYDLRADGMKLQVMCDARNFTGT